MRVSIVVYVLNELGGLQAMLPRIKEEWYDQLVFIDGGSTDGSVEYLLKNGHEVYRQIGERWAGAYGEAFRRATGDILVDFSPDGNSVPELIPELIAKIEEGNDMVTASRYLPGAHSEDDTAMTRFGNILFTAIINLLFRGHATDSLVIFRAYRRSFLEKAGILDTQLGQCITGLFTIRCARIKAKYTDIPGDEPKRLFGTSKLSVVVDGLRVVWLIVKEFWHEIRGQHPVPRTSVVPPAERSESSSRHHR